MVVGGGSTERRTWDRHQKRQLGRRGGGGGLCLGERKNSKRMAGEEEVNRMGIQSS